MILTNLEGVNPRNINKNFEVNLCSSLRVQVNKSAEWYCGRHTPIYDIELVLY